MNDKLCILVCEDYAPEVITVVKTDGYEDVQVVPFPLLCRNYSKFSGDDLERLIQEKADQCDPMCLHGDCTLTSENTSPPALTRCQTIKPGPCFSFFANQSLIDDYIQKGAYILTPGSVARWQKDIDEWGFDQKTGREFFSEFTTRLVLLDSGVNPKSIDHLKAYASFLDLPFEVIPVGLDFIRLFITKIVLEWRIKKETTKNTADHVNSKRQAADYAMALDLIGHIARLTSEAEMIENILQLFSSLCAPTCAAYVPVIEGIYGSSVTHASGIDLSPNLKRQLMDPIADYVWTDSGNGFIVRISQQNDTLGILLLEGVAFPQYITYYLNITLSIVKALALAIYNARVYQELTDSRETLIHLSAHDSLTGLFNRMFFKSELERLQSSRLFPISIIMIDINGLKEVNDRQGHLTGDLLIYRIGSIIREAFRAEEIVARIGGDEFVVMLPGTDQTGAQNAVTRLQTHIAEYNRKNPDLQISVAAGFATGEPNVNLEDVLRQADRDMYRIKSIQKTGLV